MRLVKNIATKQPLNPAVATIGFFDGVHCGHRFLIEQVQKAAISRGLASAVITFPEHPRAVMHPDFHPELLTTCDEKLELLAQTGIDSCILLDFTPELAALSARQFMERLHRQYAIQALVIGYDHRFGHGRSEGFEDYVRYGRDLGMEVLPAEAYHLPAACCRLPVCSSSIRRLLHEGDVSSAAQYLGYAYFLDGTVVDGYKLGRKLGFPTANLSPSCPDKLIPQEGVYAVYARIGKEYFKGMLNIGHRPTVNNGNRLSIEVHILNFTGNLYQQQIRIELMHFIRKEQHFPNMEALIAQLHEDRSLIENLLPTHP